LIIICVLNCGNTKRIENGKLKMENLNN